MGDMQGLNVLHNGGIRDGHVFVKLLTNRAACHLSLARPLKALQDCTMAVQVGPALHACIFTSSWLFCSHALEDWSRVWSLTLISSYCGRCRYCFCVASELHSVISSRITRMKHARQTRC